MSIQLVKHIFSALMGINMWAEHIMRGGGWGVFLRKAFKLWVTNLKLKDRKSFSQIVDSNVLVKALELPKTNKQINK